MSKKPHEPKSSHLRAEAEKKISATPPAPQSTHAPRSAEQLLHELQVHQVELEMQNETLRQTQIDLEASRDRYIGLYDFSPVAYLTLTGEGLIQGINLTGAALLGVPRAALLQRSFSTFVAEEDRSRWLRLFVAARQHAARQDCELALQRADGSHLEVRLDYLPVAGKQDASTLLVALTDITERTRTEATRAEQLEELRRWHDVVLKREMRLLGLKHEVNELLAQAGMPPRYPSAESRDGDASADRDA